MKLYLEYAFGGELNIPVVFWQFLYFVSTIAILGIMSILAILCIDVVKWNRAIIILIIWIIPTFFHIKGFIKYKRKKENNV